MVVIMGKDGTICSYWNDLLISSMPLGKRTYKHYKKCVEEFIIYSMRTKVNIKDLIEYSRQFCQTIYNKKLNKKKISSEEHHTFNISILTLIRLEIYDEDQLVLICKNKSHK
jgi:hypothetical protein